MGRFRVGCGQITWSAAAREGQPGRPSEDQILAEIAQAGYEGAPAGPRKERTAVDTLSLYARYGLAPAPGYYGDEFWKPERREMILEAARHYAAFSLEVGCTELYVAPGGFGYVARSGRSRSEVAGHVGPADGLTDDEYARFADTLQAFCAITLASGVRGCFHNHVGTVIETREEIDRLLGMVDPEVVFLGPDTGHLAWAGMDPVAFCRDYAPRIKTMHVKDIDCSVRDRGRDAGWDYAAFSRNGIFAELGAGCVDFPAIFDILRSAGFDGWLIAETDVTQKPTPLDSATISRRYLRSIGV